MIEKLKSYSGVLTSFLGTCAVAGTILAIMAPYGTHQSPFSVRLLFWIGLCMAGGMGAMIGNHFISKTQFSHKPWVLVFAQSIGATTIVFLCFLGLRVITTGWPGSEFYYTIPFFIWIISLVISGVSVLANRPSQSSNDRPDIFERIKPGLRSADIYALSAEDHYVRVITSAGDDLILMRLSDAIKETAPLIGLQVHRSWWVAEKGVKSVSRADGKMTITLNNDSVVPVSRANQKIVRDASWA